MNKEEIIVENDYIGEVTDLRFENWRLKTELKKQQEIIDKAIEYIKSNQFEENFPYVVNECQVRSALLQILEDKEVQE